MPRELRFLTADVFTDLVFGGNQLAVFVNPGDLDTATMQSIARELNLSETVFVFPAETATGTCRLRIFTPGAELPFAGHPTIGAAFVLASVGEIALNAATTQVVFEEGVGPVNVSITADDNGRPSFAQLSAAKLPEEGPPAPATEQLAAMLSLEPAQILGGTMRPRAFSCGVPFLFVTVADLAALAAARMKSDLWERHLANYWADDLFILVRGEDEGQIRARMFAPAMGIVEDPATGSAAAALTGYLTPPDADGLLRWTVQQGVEMGRPSTLYVEADVARGAITAVRVGGTAVMVSDGVFRLP